MAPTGAALYVDLLSNVQGKAIRFEKKGSHWISQTMKFPPLGKVGFLSSDVFDDIVLSDFENFLEPSAVYLTQARSDGTHLELLKKQPSRFDSSKMVADQLETMSKDGTRIPYFIVHGKNLPMNGSHPTLLYGYGGFEISMLPGYLGGTGKVWLERGGVYVLANIRGGGEFGPKWHQAALKENRQKLSMISSRSPKI